MKPKIKMLTVLLIIIICSVVFTKNIKAQQPYVSFQVFYDQLSPYGQWINNPDYGYVWIPYGGSDFVPYSTRGHWILTEYGFTWVSDYNWGWAPFHYGRWDFDNNYGWFWIPDNEWGPAWVSWRSANGYYGWSPMEPGISISVSFGRDYNRQNDHWIFVRDRDIDRPNINRYYVNRYDHDRIIQNSRVIENTYYDSRRNTKYVSGPTREDVQKVTGRRVNPVAVQENDKPGQDLRNGQLRIYRPQVNRNNDREQRPAPSRVTDMKDVKRSSGRDQVNQSRNANPPDNSRNRNQQKIENPPQQNNNSNPVQQQNANPARSRREVQQNTGVPPKSNNSTNPGQPQNTTPSNSRREIQQNTVTQPNNNTKATESQKAKSTERTKKVKQTQDVKQPGKRQAVPPTKTKNEEVKKEKN